MGGYIGEYYRGRVGVVWTGQGGGVQLQQGAEQLDKKAKKSGVHQQNRYGGGSKKKSFPLWGVVRMMA